MIDYSKMEDEHPSKHGFADIHHALPIHLQSSKSCTTYSGRSDNLSIITAPT